MPGLRELDLVALAVERLDRRICRIFGQFLDVVNSLGLHDLDHLVDGNYLWHLSSHHMFGFVQLPVQDIAETLCAPLGSSAIKSILSYDIPHKI